jgi:hypothetical protein
LSPLSAQNAGQTGLNRITQAVFSTSTWYAFAGQVTGRILYFDLVCFRGAGHCRAKLTYPWLAFRVLGQDASNKLALTGLEVPAPERLITVTKSRRDSESPLLGRVPQSLSNISRSRGAYALGTNAAANGAAT